MSPSKVFQMANGWVRRQDGGWLTGLPSYEKGEFFIAQDYDDLDTASQKLMWFLHGEDGFIQAFDTLGEAQAFIDNSTTRSR